MDNIWAQTQEPKPEESKIPLLTFIARIVSIISLLVSILMLKCKSCGNNRNLTENYYNLISSYKYMFACILVGLVYTVIQTPFAAFYALTRERLIKDYGFLCFEFYADKAIICVLGTAVGAGFGVTKDLKYGTKAAYASEKSDLDTFYNINFIASGFLGFICSIALSLFSSRPVSLDG